MSDLSRLKELAALFRPPVQVAEEKFDNDFTAVWEKLSDCPTDDKAAALLFNLVTQGEIDKIVFGDIMSASGATFEKR